MFASTTKIACAMSLCAATTLFNPAAEAKCGLCKSKPACHQPCAATTATDLSGALPPNAKPGECYAKVYVPPEYKTTTERVKVRDAYEELEVIPAEYEWVEEKVCIKDASEELHALPPEFATRAQTFELQPPETAWEINKNPTCVADSNQPAHDTFCLVNHPSVERTVQMQCLEKPARVEKVFVPAEYQTIRRQKLVHPAMTRKVCVPAEYTEIQKTVKVCDGKMIWRKVDCGNEGVVSQAPAEKPAAKSAALPNAAADALVAWE